DRGADLGGEVRESGKVVPGQRGCQGELAAGQLHAVAGVSGEAHHRGFELLPRRLQDAGTFHAQSLVSERDPAAGASPALVSAVLLLTRQVVSGKICRGAKWARGRSQLPQARKLSSMSCR